MLLWENFPWKWCCTILNLHLMSILHCQVGLVLFFRGIIWVVFIFCYGLWILIVFRLVLVSKNKKTNVELSFWEWLKHYINSQNLILETQFASDKSRVVIIALVLVKSLVFIRNIIIIPTLRVIIAFDSRKILSCSLSYASFVHIYYYCHCFEVWIEGRPHSYSVNRRRLHSIASLAKKHKHKKWKWFKK